MIYDVAIAEVYYRTVTVRGKSLKQAEEHARKNEEVVAIESTGQDVLVEWSEPVGKKERIARGLK